jgi:DNA-binding HxlR family transcriptional regulator
MVAMDDDCSSDRRSSCEGLLADCRLRAATELFAHTWDSVVLAGLRAGPRRRGELLGAIGGISDKVLSQTLHRLVVNGLVERRRYPAAPPRVEYGLSPLGASLVDGPMRELGRWAIEYGDELLEAQERSTSPLIESPADVRAPGHSDVLGELAQ